MKNKLEYNKLHLKKKEDNVNSPKSNIKDNNKKNKKNGIKKFIN